MSATTNNIRRLTLTTGLEIRDPEFLRNLARRGSMGHRSITVTNTTNGSEITINPAQLAEIQKLFELAEQERKENASDSGSLVDREEIEVVTILKGTEPKERSLGVAEEAEFATSFTNVLEPEEENIEEQLLLLYKNFFDDLPSNS